MARKRSGISGPFKHGKRWRVVVQVEGTRTVQSFETEEEARDVIAEFLQLSEGETVSHAIDRWLDAIKARGRPKITLTTLRNAVERLAKFLPVKLHAVTPRIASQAYAALVATGCAADTHRNSLNVTRSMWAHLNGKGKGNPWDAVVGVGARKRGKPQLTIDESRRFLTAALELGEHEPGGVAAAICLCLALRASEVVALEGRDVDDGGRVLWVQRGKTRAARRGLEVPEALRPALLRLAAASGNDGRLMPFSRGWVGYWVGEVCKAANVRRVPPHGLRGTHATIAASAGATAQVVATALGHAGVAVTREHYIAPGAEESATARLMGRRMEAN
jgi:integrase